MIYQVIAHNISVSKIKFTLNLNQKAESLRFSDNTLNFS